MNEPVDCGDGEISWPNNNRNITTCQLINLQEKAMLSSVFADHRQVETIATADYWITLGEAKLEEKQYDTALNLFGPCPGAGS
jgi:hypothetical protein